MEELSIVSSITPRLIATRNGNTNRRYRRNIAE